MSNSVRLYKTVNPAILHQHAVLIESLFQGMSQGIEANVRLDNTGFIYGRNLDIRLGLSGTESLWDRARSFFIKSNELAKKSSKLVEAGISTIFPESLTASTESQDSDSEDHLTKLTFDLKLKPQKNIEPVEVLGAEAELQFADGYRLTGFNLHFRPILTYKEVPLFNLVFPKDQRMLPPKLYYIFTDNNTYIKPYFLLRSEKGQAETFPACIYSQ